MSYANPDATNVVANGTGWDVTPTGDPAKDRDNVQFAVDHGTGVQPIALLKTGVFDFGGGTVFISKDVMVKGDGIGATIVKNGGDQTANGDAAVGADNLATGLARAELSTHEMWHAATGGVGNILTGAFLCMSPDLVSFKAMEIQDYLGSAIKVRKSNGLSFKDMKIHLGRTQVSLFGRIAMGIMVSRIKLDDFFQTFDVSGLPELNAGAIEVKDVEIDLSALGVPPNGNASAFFLAAFASSLSVKDCTFIPHQGALSAFINGQIGDAADIEWKDNSGPFLEMIGIGGNICIQDCVVDASERPIPGPFSLIIVSQTDAGVAADNRMTVKDCRMVSHPLGNENAIHCGSAPAFGIGGGGAIRPLFQDLRIDGLFLDVLYCNTSAAFNTNELRWTNNPINVALFAGGHHAYLSDETTNALIVGLDPAQSEDHGQGNIIALSKSSLSAADKQRLKDAKDAAEIACPKGLEFGLIQSLQR